MKRFGLIFVNIVFWSFFILSSIALYIGALAIRLLTLPFDPNRKILQQFSCFWASLYLWVNPFWSLKKTGLENVARGRPYVIVVNHQSMADILCLFNTFLHFKWVAKKPLFKLPLLGWNMVLNGYVPIDRGNPESRERCMAACRAWLKRGSSVLFFPEGTRSRDGRLQAFKPGAFHLAVASGCDLLPIVIRGSLHAIPKHSLLLSGKSRMELEVLAPLAIRDFVETDLTRAADRLSEATRKLFLEKLGPAVY